MEHDRGIAGRYDRSQRAFVSGKMSHLAQDSVKVDTSDPDRLAELEALDVMDTASEEGFDDAVQIARLICQTPVALASLVAADRQWFKARVGFPDCQTDLSRSVCVYALGEPDLLVIPDLTTDPRTRTNPLVVGEPHIRFYAGAPLRMPSGRVIGSLCVIDHQPRPDGLSEDQAEALRRLARQVMILLRERRQLARMQAAEVQAGAATNRRLALIELGDQLRDIGTIPEMTAKAAEIVGRTLNASRAGYGELDRTGAFVTVPEGLGPARRGPADGTPPPRRLRQHRRRHRTGRNPRGRRRRERHPDRSGGGTVHRARHPAPCSTCRCASGAGPSACSSSTAPRRAPGPRRRSRSPGTSPTGCRSGSPACGRTRSRRR